MKHATDDSELASQPVTNPFQRVIRSNHRAKDITSDFTNACELLHIGKLVKDESFTLFDSVQALEIMDPKMDTGFFEKGESLEDDYDVSRSLTAEEVIGVMDQLLSYEMSWHQGYPLAQNLFSSLYIDHILVQSRRPKEFPIFGSTDGFTANDAGHLVHLVLLAYCIGVIKSCDIVIEMIQSQHYYEEEDFNTHTFNRNMLTDLDDDICLKMLMEAEEWLNDQKNIEKEVIEALILRLRIRRDFYDAILPTFSETLTESDWIQMESRIHSLITSHNLEKPVNVAFSSNIQRRLASTVPPRPITDLKFGDACQNLINLYKDLQESLRISQQNPINDIEHLLLILLTYSSREPAPSPLARSELQSLVFSEGRVADINGIKTLMWQTLERTLPNSDNYINDRFWGVETPTDRRYKCARVVDYFIEQASPEFGNLLRAVCQNRCRVRRSLTNIIQDLYVTQQNLVNRYLVPNTPDMDTAAIATAHEYILERSIVLNVDLIGLFILDWIHRLGFEHDLYQNHELHHMYHITAKYADLRAENFNGQKALADFILRSGTRKFFGKTKMESSASEQLTARLVHRVDHCEAVSKFAQSLCILYIMIDRLEGMRQTPTPPPYEAKTLRWEARLRPFSGLGFGRQSQVSPEFSDLLEKYYHTTLRECMCQAQESNAFASKLLRTSISAARERAKQEDSLPASEAYDDKDLQDTYRACIAAAVALATLKKAMDKFKEDTEVAENVIITHSHLLKNRWIVAKITLK